MVVHRVNEDEVRFFGSPSIVTYSNFKVVAALLLCSLNGRAPGVNLGGAGSSPVFLKGD